MLELGAEWTVLPTTNKMILHSVFTATAGWTVKPKMARLKDDIKSKPVSI